MITEQQLITAAKNLNKAVQKITLNYIEFIGLEIRPNIHYFWMKVDDGLVGHHIYSKNTDSHIYAPTLASTKRFYNVEQKIKNYKGGNYHICNETASSTCD